ncbi:MAG: hypothetical protein IK123_09095, partial [Lachnospiraceae bacterium]|nr:hypothetical protein [Lachnospiraceae bacterium]
MDMTITKSQRDLLIGLAGVLIAVLCWFLVASPTIEKRENLETENKTLRPKAEEYQAVHARVDEYKSSITALDVEIDELVSHLPPKVERPDQLMFWANMAASYPTDLRFDDIELGDWDAVAVAGLDESSVNKADVSVDEDGNPQIADEAVPDLEADYKLYGATMDMNFASSYTGLKLLLNYIYSQHDKNSIQGIDVTYDEEDGYLQGELFMELFYVEGTDKEYVPAFIPSVPTGVDDLFHTEGMGLADILKASIEKALEEKNASEASETKAATGDNAPAYLRKGDATVYH